MRKYLILLSLLLTSISTYGLSSSAQLLYNLFQQNNNYQNYIKKFKSDEGEMTFYDALQEVIVIVMNELIEYNFTSNLTSQCVNNMKETFFILNQSETNETIIEEHRATAYYYYAKLFLDSSKNLNDLSTYIDCMDREHIYNESQFTNKTYYPSYLTLFIDHRSKMYEILTTGNGTATYFVGVCFIKGCSEKDHKKIVAKTMRILGMSFGDESDNLIIYSMEKNNDEYRAKGLILCLKLIPAFILIFHVGIILFNKLFIYIYKKLGDICCKKCKKRNRIKLAPKLQNLDKNSIYSGETKLDKSNISNHSSSSYNFKNIFKSLFNVENNIEILFDIKKKDKNYDDRILSYMNGIKGLSMILTIFGYVYVDLYNSPIAKQDSDTFYSNISSFFFIIFYFGVKFAPKLLICSSGFSLFYKFLCFLDDKVEIEMELQKQKEEYDESSNKENNDNNAAANTGIKTAINEDNNSNKNKKKKDIYLISFKYYFLFVGYQLHKYILYFIMLLYFLFSLYELGSVFIDLGPMWVFFDKRMIKSSYTFKALFSSFFCFQDNFLNTDRDSILNYFYLIYQEVIYFIISTFIIFIGFRNHLRIDRFFVVTMFILWVLRIIRYLLDDNLNDSVYFTFADFGLFFNSILYNYIYYVIGIYFGSLNYVIQKRYNFYECERKKKYYLISYSRFLKIIKKKSKLFLYSLGIIFYILILFLSCNQFIILGLIRFYRKDGDSSTILTIYEESGFVKLIMFFDTDIVILLVNLMGLFLYLQGENSINSFLNLPFWIIFNKIYFSFILLINPVILYVFYNSETKVSFDLPNCYLYSFACGILIFSIVVIVYLIFELPFKKVGKLLFRESEVMVSTQRLTKMENSFNTSLISQYELLQKSIASENSAEEREEEEENKEEF